MVAWLPAFARLASQTNVTVEEIERQTRLHLPHLSAEAMDGCSAAGPPETVLEVVARRVRNLKNDIQSHLERSNARKLGAGETKLVANKSGICFRFDDGSLVPGRFDIVSEEDGLYIEKRLHYLRSPRIDAVARYGLYVDDAKMPICYLSFTPCDRAYIRLALSRSIDRSIDIAEVVVLARTYGIDRLPKNAVSFTISRACQSISDTKKRFVITAINPFLGFDGPSMTPSGFTTFALAPVAYNYRSNGEYVARRLGENAATAGWRPPPNVLLVRGMDKHSRRELTRVSKILKITEAHHAEAGND